MAPTRSIDRKLDALQKRIEAERKSAPMTRPPTDGLTSTMSTENCDIPRKAASPTRQPTRGLSP